KTMFNLILKVLMVTLVCSSSDESSCLPPTIPNGKYPKSSNGWYDDGSTLTITCDGGFEHQNQINTTTCGNGKWSSAPVCERSMSACSAPPKIPHAVIIHGYQEVFAAGSEVQYECEDRYTAHTEKSVCIQGNWTAVPTFQSCGNFPVIENAVAQQTSRYYLIYRCPRLYRLVGPERVKCISNGMWSDLPECRGINTSMIIIFKDLLKRWGEILI
uniref:Sushi domain-containing protein n=1 Tax=Haplochromis burtoni TaxID=8153 RepID=A0A3Q2VUU2_HAPBU